MHLGMYVFNSMHNCKHILYKYNLSCTSMHCCTGTAISKYNIIVRTSSQLLNTCELGTDQCFVMMLAIR